MRTLSKTAALRLPDLAGLDQPSLFDTKPVPTGEPLMVPIDPLDQDADNPRTEYPLQAIDELAQDIASAACCSPSSSRPPTNKGGICVTQGRNRTTDTRIFNLARKLTRSVAVGRSSSAKARANREKALLSRLFNEAREWGYTDAPNPCQGVSGVSRAPIAQVHILRYRSIPASTAGGAISPM